MGTETGHRSRPEFGETKPGSGEPEPATGAAPSLRDRDMGTEIGHRNSPEFGGPGLRPGQPEPGTGAAPNLGNRALGTETGHRSSPEFGGPGPRPADPEPGTGAAPSLGNRALGTETRLRGCPGRVRGERLGPTTGLGGGPVRFCRRLRGPEPPRQRPRGGVSGREGARLSHRAGNRAVASESGAVCPVGARLKKTKNPKKKPKKKKKPFPKKSRSMERRDDPCSSSSAAASSAPRLKEELLCPICYEPFREAVTLPCGHNFCRSCICKSWENRTHACPLCKERSSLDELRINHTLRNLVELILKEEGPWRGGGAALCSAHQQEPKFFCLEDKELACFGCQNSKEHEGHKMRPVQEAAADFRAKLANMETSLRDKAKDFAAVRRSFEAISRHNEVESGRLESQVKWEFEKLHKFLWDEEQAVLAQLREETGRKQDLIQAKLQQLADATQALLNEAARLQADLQQDDLTFLMTHKNRKRRIACTAEEPEAVPPGIVVDVAKYLGSLQYNVWKKMLDTITAFPFSLDPNSAAGWLSISEDLSSVSSCCYKGSVDNPERFTSAPCILGSRGFSEGFHTWEVDLGGLTNWRVGVSRPHKGSHWSCHHDSRSGFWYIYHLHGKDECRASNAVRSQTALGNIRRVRVELDCTEGELSFYDADLQSHIYTFHEKFGGVVFPYFYIGSSQGDANTKTLRICPLRIRVREDVLT